MGKRVLAFIIVAVLMCGPLQQAASAQGPTEEEQALYDEAADLVQRELDLLVMLDGSSDDMEVLERLRVIEDEGLAMIERLGTIIEVAPRIEDALSPFPSNAGRVQPPNASQRMFYLEVVAELRSGLPTAHGALAGGPLPPPRGSGPIAAGPSATDDGSTWPRFVLIGVAIVAAGGALLHRRRRDVEHAELVELAMTDELTKLSNRRRLEADLLTHAERPGGLGVAMIDIDLFKRLNDRHGHIVGDGVLREIGATIAANVRASDVVYRYGGEEFCVLIPDASEDEALRVVERVRAAIAALDLTEIDETVTVSAGVALGASGHGAATLREADSALYEAKRAGRNRVVPHAGR